MTSPALAEDAPRKARSLEVFGGADVSASSWLLYSGATVVPSGGHIHDDGVRLRAVLGYGGYRYEGARLERKGTNSREVVDKRFSAATGFSEVLAGYLQRFGPLTAKAFAGVSIISHEIAPFDTDNEVQGAEVGLKGVVELWFDAGDGGWTSFDLGYGQAHETGSARLRTGYRVSPGWSAGLETIVDANAEHRQGRSGLFLRYEWDGGEISAAGGVSGDLPNAETLEFPTTPYGAVNLISHF